MGHVDGATRIVEVRGAEQLDHSAGLELFRHLRVGIVSTITDTARFFGLLIQA